MGNNNSFQSERARFIADSMQSKFTEFRTHNNQTWGYTREQGPDTWSVFYPAANGEQQSPIDIDPSTAEFDTDLATYPLKISYQDESRKILWNTGYGCQINIKERGSYIEGGPLKNRYQLEQFHFHWGDRDDCGSEHTVNGQPYSAELHLVHWNCEKYGTFNEALDKPDGLAVLGVLMKVSQSKNEFLETFTGQVNSIIHKLQSTPAPAEFNPSVLLPKDKSKYWVYQGSLTTPPCYESVTWILFYEPVPISSQQLEAFRSLRSFSENEEKPLNEHNGFIMENFRPVQPLRGRRVSALEHIFTSCSDRDEQFHDQGLFLSNPEMMCQQHRQGLPHEHTDCPAKHLCKYYKPL